MEELFNILDYNSAVEYLLKKYGPVAKNYCSENWVVTKDTKKLDRHHIKENEIENLSNMENACKYDYEYQKAENLCYCNRLEHLYLHYLIAKESGGKHSLGGIKKLIEYMDSEFRDTESFDQLCAKLYQLFNGNESLLNPWNTDAYKQLELYLGYYQSALVSLFTCGGKTNFAREYLRRNNNLKAIALGPSTTIKNGWDEQLNVKSMTYQTFMDNYKTLNYDTYRVVICDEAHHVKADRWGEGIRWILDNCPQVKVIGLTATPTAEQLEGTDREFQGRICRGFDLADALKEEIIWPFSYVQAIYKLADLKGEFDEYGTTGKVLWDKLNMELNANPVEKILKDKMPAGRRKIIVFCQDTNYVREAKEIMKKYNPSLDIRVLTSKEDDNDTTRAWFADDSTSQDKCLITVNMVNEGVHYRNINTLVMFRSTKSVTLYMQQIGRLICPQKDKGGNTIADPNGIVFDFTNNAQSLIYSSKALKIGDDFLQLNEPDKTIKVLKDIIKSKRCGQDKIFEDYTANCAECFFALKESQNEGTINNNIIKLFTGLGISAADFGVDIWDAPTEGNVLAKRVKARDKKHNKNKSAISSGYMPEEVEEDVENINNSEKLICLFKLVLSGLYRTNLIVFDDAFDIHIVDDKKFETFLNFNKITKVAEFREVLKKVSGVNCYIYLN